MLALQSNGWPGFQFENPLAPLCIKWISWKWISAFGSTHPASFNLKTDLYATKANLIYMICQDYLECNQNTNDIKIVSLAYKFCIYVQIEIPISCTCPHTLGDVYGLWLIHCISVKFTLDWWSGLCVRCGWLSCNLTMQDIICWICLKQYFYMQTKSICPFFFVCLFSSWNECNSECASLHSLKDVCFSSPVHILPEVKID